MDFPMRTPLLYHVGTTALRFALGIYFKKLEIVGSDIIPRKGPVIIAANHPQSITDAVVLALRAGRMVHYLAHSGLFNNPFRAWLLRSVGVIPVHRRADVADASDKNIQMFSACEELLERGGVIGIFPEGVSAEQRHIHKLKTGAARMALQTEEKNGWRLGVSIIPAGLSFESKRRMRTRVLLRFGIPLAAADYHEEYHRDPVEGVYGLTHDLETAIRALVVDIERPEFEALVRDIEHIYKDEIITRRLDEIRGESRFGKEQSAAAGIAKALDFFLEKRPEVVGVISNLVTDYRRKLDRLKIRDEMLRDKKERTVTRETIKLVIWGLLGFPFAAYGALWNFLPYRFTGWLSGRMARNSTLIHYTQITQGALVYSVYYALLLFVAYPILGLTGTLIFGATLPPTGIFARAYTRFMVRRQRMLRFTFFKFTHHYYVQKISQQRRDVIEAMDDALEEYLSQQ